MCDPVTVPVKLEGQDAEACAINAIVQILEVVHFRRGQDDEKLTSEEKARVTLHVARRYGGADFDIRLIDACIKRFLDTPIARR